MYIAGIVLVGIVPSSKQLVLTLRVSYMPRNINGNGLLWTILIILYYSRASYIEVLVDRDAVMLYNLLADSPIHMHAESWIELV